MPISLFAKYSASVADVEKVQVAALATALAVDLTASPASAGVVLVQPTTKKVCRSFNDCAILLSCPSFRTETTCKLFASCNANVQGMPANLNWASTTY